MRSLPDLQRAFFDAIVPSNTAPATRPAHEIAAEICGDARLSADDRLAVYARMYVARLSDVLREDYPRVGAVLGAETFGELAHAYVARHPSTQPSLRWFGRSFPAFLRCEQGERGLPAFVADLAQLEWTRLAVFDAADDPALTMEELRAIPPAAWPTLRFRFVAAVEALHVGWPVHRIWEASEGGGAAGGWEPEDTRLRVWREDARVYQARMDAVEHLAFGSVEAGDDFESLCDGLATAVPAERAAETAGAILLRWIEDGIVARMVTRRD